ncbi:MAG: VTT domain-containing protein [Planctomycetota bacterium]
MPTDETPGSGDDAVDEPAFRQSAGSSRSENDPVPAKQPRGWRLLRMLLPILILVGCVAAIKFGKAEMLRVRDACGIWAPAITVPIHAVVAAAPVPSDVIAIANGTLYGYVPGVVYSWVGWLLGSILEFQVIRSLATSTARYDKENRRNQGRLPRWLTKFPAGHPAFLILGRQIPGAGAHITIIAAAVTKVSWRRFLICSVVAIVPAALLMPAIGAKLL